jgi:hypothetical protein
MFDVLLAGPYPAGTLEKLQKAVEGTDISIRAVLTEEEFAKKIMWTPLSSGSSRCPKK